MDTMFTPETEQEFSGTNYPESRYKDLVQRRSDRTEGTGGTGLFHYEKSTHRDGRLPFYRVSGTLSSEESSELRLADTQKQELQRLVPEEYYPDSVQEVMDPSWAPMRGYC